GNSQPGIAGSCRLLGIAGQHLTEKGKEHKKHKKSRPFLVLLVFLPLFYSELMLSSLQSAKHIRHVRFVPFAVSSRFLTASLSSVDPVNKSSGNRLYVKMAL